MPTERLSPKATYMTQYPNARVEILASSVMKVLQLLLDGPEAPTHAEAHAASLYLDTVILPMAVWTTAVENAIANHHPDPANWTVPESQTRLAAEIGELTQRYDQLLNTRFPGLDRNETPAKAPLDVLTLYQDLALGHAAERINGEILSRPANDPTGKAYHRALRDHAREMRSNEPTAEWPEDHPLAQQARRARAITARILPAMNTPETGTQ